MGDSRLRYEEYRAAAREATIEDWVTRLVRERSDANVPQISLVSISDAAIRFWQAHWPQHYRTDIRTGRFDWADLKERFRAYPKRFELAIWGDGTLCGMAYGRPSPGDENLTLHFLERYWGKNPLGRHIAPLAIDNANAYAKLLGKHKLFIKAPAKGAIPVYESLGFEAVQRSGRHAYYGRDVY